MGGNRLGSRQRRLLVLLALPALGLSLAYTLVAAYLPVPVHRLRGDKDRDRGRGHARARAPRPRRGGGGELRAVDFLLFEETKGFSAVFAVAAFMHLGVPFLRRIGVARSKPNEETAI